MSTYNIQVASIELADHSKIVRLDAVTPDGDLHFACAMSAATARIVAKWLTDAADKADRKVITFGSDTAGTVVGG